MSGCCFAAGSSSFDWLVQGGGHNAGNVPQEAEMSDRFNPLHDDADPVGTRTTHQRTADFPPHAREMVRKYYPDGTSRAWFRRRGGEWTAVELDGPEPLPREAAAEIRRDNDDALAREARKPCAVCGHAQFLHCDDHDDPCGCIPNPRTPVEDRCQCKQFVDPEVAP